MTAKMNLKVVIPVALVIVGVSAVIGVVLMLLAGDSETEFRAVTIGEPVSIELPAQKRPPPSRTIAARASRYPQARNIESTTVSVAEVEPPVSFVPVGRVFDFSIVDRDGKEVELQQPVTVTLPYELPEGKEHSDVWCSTGMKRKVNGRQLMVVPLMRPTKPSQSR